MSQPIWSPSRDRVVAANLTRFLSFLNEEGLQNALHLGFYFYFIFWNHFTRCYCFLLNVCD